MKNIVLLGSTGSVGTQALQVAEAFPDAYRVLALSAHTSVDLLLAQAERTRAQYIGVVDTAAAKALQGRLPAGTRLCIGPDANAELAALPEADIILIGLSGFAGLSALLAAIQAGKTVALANKESIICGSRLVKEALETYNGRIIPVDSEHSAIFQCLQNGRREEVAGLHITASGGPFRSMTQAELATVTYAQALRHPVWSMGKKISVDSATLMNKGLEVIEASYLFDMPQCNIFVLIHPQSIIHSMVEYIDGTVIAQLSSPDMRLAIQYALGYPARQERQIKRLSLPEIGSLSFESGENYAAIRLARDVLQEGADTLPIAYCIADEVAVDAFAEGRLSFLGILHTVEHVVSNMQRANIHSVEDVLLAAADATALAKEFINRA